LDLLKENKALIEIIKMPTFFSRASTRTSKGIGFRRRTLIPKNRSTQKLDNVATSENECHSGTNDSNQTASTCSRTRSSPIPINPSNFKQNSVTVGYMVMVDQDVQLAQASQLSWESKNDLILMHSNIQDPQDGCSGMEETRQYFAESCARQLPPDKFASLEIFSTSESKSKSPPWETSYSIFHRPESEAGVDEDFLLNSDFSRIQASRFDTGDTMVLPGILSGTIQRGIPSPEDELPRSNLFYSLNSS